MKDQLYNIFSQTAEMSIQDITINILMSAVIGFVIFISYAISHKGTLYSRKFNASLVMMTVLTATVMTVIGNNIALSLGMVGALSIVRFRTAVKDSRDTVYIFWTVIVGICCGVGDFQVAAIGTAVTFVIILILGFVKSDNRMLLIIRAARNKQSVIQAQVFKMFSRKAILRVRNTTEETVEFIYEISSKQLKAVEKNNVNVTDVIYDIGGVDYVNIVMQNDEVSS